MYMYLVWDEMYSCQVSVQCLVCIKTADCDRAGLS